MGRCKQEQRGLRGYYVAGPPLLNGRCTSLLKGPRLRNDLYCVEWDVKLYYTISYANRPTRLHNFLGVDSGCLRCPDTSRSRLVSCSTDTDRQDTRRAPRTAYGLAACLPACLPGRRSVTTTPLTRLTVHHNATVLSCRVVVCRFQASTSSLTKTKISKETTITTSSVGGRNNMLPPLQVDL